MGCEFLCKHAIESYHNISKYCMWFSEYEVYIHKTFTFDGWAKMNPGKINHYLLLCPDRKLFILEHENLKANSLSLCWTQILLEKVVRHCPWRWFKRLHLALLAECSMVVKPDDTLYKPSFHHKWQDIVNSVKYMYIYTYSARSAK